MTHVQMMFLHPFFWYFIIREEKINNEANTVVIVFVLGLKVINVSIVKSNQNELFILYLINMALTERILQYYSIYSKSVSRENNNVCFACTSLNRRLFSWPVIGWAEKELANDLRKAE